MLINLYKIIYSKFTCLPNITNEEIRKCKLTNKSDST